MKTNAEFKQWLMNNNACSQAFRWLGERTPEETFNECHRADWLLFWIGKGINQKLEGYPTLMQYKKASIEIAKTIKPLVKDERINKVFELLDQYLITENKDLAIEARKISLEIWIAADDAAYAAAYAADAAAYADASDDAAYAAYAAAADAADDAYAAAADAAYAAAADSAAAAADSAAAAYDAAAAADDAYDAAAYDAAADDAAAYAAAADDAYAAAADAAYARDAKRLECAEIVRKYCKITF